MEIWWWDDIFYNSLLSYGVIRNHRTYSASFGLIDQLAAISWQLLAKRTVIYQGGSVFLYDEIFTYIFDCRKLINL